jgi:hypothetical protein
MTLTITLSDEDARGLQAKAAANGLSLEEWVQKLAEQESASSKPRKHIADMIVENMRGVSPEIMAGMPEDGASQHDHYVYGWPKKEE